MRNFRQHVHFFLMALLLGCAGPKFIPADLSTTRSPPELAAKTQESYAQAKAATEKSEKLKWAHAGISYADKCIALAPRTPACFYYRALNTGMYIQNHIPNYQKGLRQMVADCETLNDIQPDFEHAGCYRVLGNIYAKAPSFSLNPKNVTQDWDKSVENLQSAVKLAPDYPLNQLFLARSLEAVGNKEEAKAHLLDFDRLSHAGLDNDYPDWKQDRGKLAQKLLGEKANEKSADANQ